MLEEQRANIRKLFGPAIESELHGYLTAELLLDDGTWEAWPDLPIRLEWGSRHLIAISWSKFDDLWLAPDESLPFPIQGSTVRWVRNGFDRLNGAVGAKIRSVALGRGQMSVKGTELEIWTRLLIETDRGWLEVFNTLDENGYDFHMDRPRGTLVSCI